ncbi:hypothetical protein [Actinoplanes aureus]|jgi:hypothetical protein|uniref:Uncharacterized protein n=1 Tax=Actinoplanes aureus TaxID=2792083 RepID=A0A931G2T9_9ACTN|nr:hypothetical protein [Actinoplanes aureus]MBG0568107.1 hypothetical protein [Actinoplanes aureus]
MMDAALDVAYQVVDALFGPGSTVPWWAWIAPLVMIFGRLMMPALVPQTAPAKFGKDKKSKKAKKGKK